MRLTIDIAREDLYKILKENAPERTTPPGPIGKIGTNMYSPYPGNLKNNGIYRGTTIGSKTQVVLSGVDGKVGYLPYTEKTSKKPGWQQKSISIFVSKICTEYGGKVV